MSDQTPDLAALEALAEAILNGWQPMNAPVGAQFWWQAETLVRRGWMSDNDAKFVAAADPATVLWLIREVRDLRDGVAELERQLDAAAKHAALGPGESCDVCTHRSFEDLLAEAEEAEAEVGRLTRWQAEALPVISGLQEPGTALGLPLGARITGPVALAAVERLTARAEKAEAAIARIEAMPVGPPSGGYFVVSMREVRAALDGGEPNV